MLPRAIRPQIPNTEMKFTATEMIRTATESHTAIVVLRRSLLILGHVKINCFSWKTTFFPQEYWCFDLPVKSNGLGNLSFRNIYYFPGFHQQKCYISLSSESLQIQVSTFPEHPFFLSIIFFSGDLQSFPTSYFPCNNVSIMHL